MIYMYSKRNKYFVLLIIQIDKIHFIGFMSSIIFLILYSAIHKAYGVGILTQGGKKMIKEVKIKRNVIMVNKNHERGYDNEKGVMIIEEENGTKHILDLESNNNITHCDYLDIIDTEETKEEILFKEVLFDTDEE